MRKPFTDFATWLLRREAGRPRRRPVRGEAGNSMDPGEYRGLIGRFATGVTVVTTAVGGRLHGMTANAVCSLSLEPLRLLVCVDRQSNCHAEMQRAEGFGLSILAADQEEVSNLFARTSEPAEGSLQGAEYRLGALGQPLIENALVHLECRIAELLDGGDHVIVIGDVVAGEGVREAAPLLFYAGRYARLGGPGPAEGRESGSRENRTK